MGREFTKEENIRWQNSLPTKRVAAGVLLWDDQGRVLIVKPNYREEWNLPGGIVDEAESPLDAAVREVEEELGLKLDPTHLRLVATNYSPEMEHFKDFIALMFDGGKLSEEQISSIKLQAEELDEFRMASVQEARKLLNEMKGRTVEAAAKNQGPHYLVATKPLE